MASWFLKKNTAWFLAPIWSTQLKASTTVYRERSKHVEHTTVDLKKTRNQIHMTFTARSGIFHIWNLMMILNEEKTNRATPTWEFRPFSSRTQDSSEYLSDWGLWKQKYGMWKAWASHADNDDDRGTHTRTHRRAGGKNLLSEWAWQGREAWTSAQSPVPLHLPLAAVS